MSMAFEANLKLLLSNAGNDETLLFLHAQLYARNPVNKTRFDSVCRGLKFGSSADELGCFVKSLVRKISPENACAVRTASSYIFMRVSQGHMFILDADSAAYLISFLLQESDESVQCNVIRAMSNLATLQQNAGLFIASVPRILHIVGETRDVTLLLNCFRAIRYLCQQLQDIRLLIKHDVLLSKICDIVQDSSAALKNASTDEADFYERDSVEGNKTEPPLAVDAVDIGQREKRLRVAVSTLIFVTRPRAQLIVASSPYVQHLERAVPLVCELTHNEHADIQTTAVEILHNLAECPAARPYLETSGAIRSLVDYIAPIGLSSSSFTSGSPASKSQLESARALFLLCADGSSRSKIRRLGALRLLLEILKADQYKTIWMRGIEAVLMYNYDLHALKELLSIGLMEVLIDKLNALLPSVYCRMLQQPVLGDNLKEDISSTSNEPQAKSSIDMQRSVQNESSKRRLSFVDKLLNINPAAPNITKFAASLDADRSTSPPPTQPLKRRRLTAAVRLSHASSATRLDVRSSSPVLSLTPLSMGTKHDSNVSPPNMPAAASVDNFPMGGRLSRSSTPMQSPSYLRAMSPPSNSFDLCGNLIRSLDRLNSSASPPYNSPPYRSPATFSGEFAGNRKVVRQMTDTTPDSVESSPALMPAAVSREADLCIKIVKFAFHISHSDEFASHVCIEKFFALTARILFLFTPASLRTPPDNTARQLVTTVSSSLRLLIPNRTCFESIVKAKCASWVDAFDKFGSKLLPLPENYKFYERESSEAAVNQISQFRLELLGELVNVAQSNYGFGTISHMLQSSNRDHTRRIIALCVPHVYRRSNLLKRLLLYDGALRSLLALVFESNFLLGNGDSSQKHTLTTEEQNIDSDEMMPDAVAADSVSERASLVSHDCRTSCELLVEGEGAASPARRRVITPNPMVFTGSGSSVETDSVVDGNAMRALRGLQLIMQSVNNHNAQQPRIGHGLLQGVHAVLAAGNRQTKSLLSTSLSATTCCVYEMFTENRPSALPGNDEIITLAITRTSNHWGEPQTSVLRCSARRSALIRSSSYFEAMLAGRYTEAHQNDVVINVLGLEDIDLEATAKSSPHRGGNDVAAIKDDGKSIQEASHTVYAAKQLHAYRSHKRDEQTLRAFVHALHGCSPTSCRLMASLWETNTSQFILKFLLVADAFLCESLFSLCLEWLQQNCLTEDSVADVYSLAQNRLTNVKGLSDACIRFSLGEVADVERISMIFCDFVQCSSVEILRSHVEQVVKSCLQAL